MNAIEVVDGKLVWREVAEPAVGPGQVRIAVKATACNRADLVQRIGLYPPPPGTTEVLGLECSGHVEAVGAGVTHLREGDAVCALLDGGGYAERAVCDARQALPVPEGVDLVDAAAIPEVFATVWFNLFHEGRLVRGERALVHAGASGVGTAAIQMCREAGVPVAVTVGSDEKVARCKDLGADFAWNRKAGSWADAVAQWTRGEGVDVVLDPVGGSYVADDISILNADGRIVVIGLLAGRSTTLDLGRLLKKRLRVIGSTLRSRAASVKGAIMTGVRDSTWERFEDGRIRPIIDTRLPIAEAEAAHLRLASDATFGKIVLVVS